MKAKDYLIIPRSKIEERIEMLESSLEWYKKNMPEYSTLQTEAKIGVLKSVLTSSAPLLPYAEQCWDGGVISGSKSIIREGDKFVRIDTNELQQAKQQFLNQEL